MVYLWNNSKVKYFNTYYLCIGATFSLFNNQLIKCECMYCCHHLKKTETFGPWQQFRPQTKLIII